jgi:heme/copper-type cytochrome/quinol oxidase subunit 3
MINGSSVLMFGSFLGIYTTLVMFRPSFCDIREDDVQRNTRDITTMILLTISWVLMFIGVSVKENDTEILEPMVENV